MDPRVVVPAEKVGAGLAIRPAIHLIEAGELGSSMYIVVQGVEIHRGDTVVAELRRGEVFGELAALDPEQRTASVWAREDTKLLRLDHEALFEMMAQRVEVAHAIIRVLVRRYGRRNSADFPGPGRQPSNSPIGARWRLQRGARAVSRGFLAV